MVKSSDKIPAKVFAAIVATGIALPLMFNIILKQVPKSKIGTMMGVGNLITGAAPALGPTFGGIVINSCCNPFG